MEMWEACACKELPRPRSLRPRGQGAAAAELCYVAAGRFEARIEGLLGPWDIAAGSIILMNAGGKVTDYSGGGDFYSGREVLATNGKLHDEFLKVLGKK